MESTWFLRGYSRRALLGLRPMRLPLPILMLLAQGVSGGFPTLRLLRFVSLPSSLSTALTRSFYSFFFSFFHSALPSLTVQVVFSFSRLPRVVGHLSFVGNAWIERRRCARARICVGTHRGMRDSVAMELLAGPSSSTLNSGGLYAMSSTPGIFFRCRIFTA